MQKTESQHGIETRELQKTKDRNRTWNRGKTITEGKKGKPTWNRGKIITEGKRQKAKVEYMESRQDHHRSQHAMKAPQFQNKILNNNNKI